MSSAGPSSSTGDAATYCTGCGEPLLGPSAGDHQRCRTLLVLDPPRFCPHCRRRMVVQVLPSGWTARCSQHGSVRS